MMMENGQPFSDWWNSLHVPMFFFLPLQEEFMNIYFFAHFNVFWFVNPIHHGILIIIMKT